MSKGAASPPAAADPSATAAAQTQSNVATAQTQAALNNANVYSPYGSSLWTPSTNAQGQTTYALNQQLSPELQQLFGSQVGLAQGLAGLAGGPQGVAGTGYNVLQQGAGLLGSLGGIASQIPTSLNLGGVAPITQLSPGSFQTSVAQGPVQGSVGANFPQLVQQAQNAAYQSQTQYLNPQWGQAQSNLTQQLADQGIEEGTPAYSRATLDFNNQKQQAYQSAQDQAVAAGNQQQQALFGESLGAGQFANQAQQQMFGQGLQLADLYNQSVLGAAGQQNTAAQLGLQQTLAQANQPINALQALLGAGTGSFGAGLQGITGMGSLANLAPTWPISMPTMGGTPTTVTPTSYAGIQQASALENNVAAQQAQNNIAGIGSLGSQALLGSNGIGGLFGSSGLLGSMFGNSVAPSALSIAGLPAGTGLDTFLNSVMGMAL